MVPVTVLPPTHDVLQGDKATNRNESMFRMKTLKKWFERPWTLFPDLLKRSHQLPGERAGQESRIKTKCEEREFHPFYPTLPLLGIASCASVTRSVVYQSAPPV